MRAIVFKKVGVPPEFLDVDLAPPGPGEVRVKYELLSAITK